MGTKVIIDEILVALDAFEAYGKPAKAIFLGAERIRQVRYVTAAYRAAVGPDEEETDSFLGLPIRAGDFPPDYIGFAA